MGHLEEFFGLTSRIIRDIFIVCLPMFKFREVRKCQIQGSFMQVCLVDNSVQLANVILKDGIRLQTCLRGLQPVPIWGGTTGFRVAFSDYVWSIEYR